MMPKKWCIEAQYQYKHKYEDAKAVMEQRRKKIDNSLFFCNVTTEHYHDRRTKKVYARYMMDLTILGKIYYFLKNLIIIPG